MQGLHPTDWKEGLKQDSISMTYDWTNDRRPSMVVRFENLYSQIKLN